jgi:hypothetical protein
MILLTVLSGCSAPTGNAVKTVRQIPVTNTVELYSDEAYTVTESKVVGRNCIERVWSEVNDSRFNISIGEKEWLGQPPVVGETNYVRRVVQIYNGKNEIDTIWLDKIYLYDGKETRRSKNPMMFLIDPKSTRTLYVMWDTQYDPLKDITIDFTNQTEELGFETRTSRVCYDEKQDFNTTKYRKVKTGEKEEVVEYNEVVRVTLPKK